MRLPPLCVNPSAPSGASAIVDGPLPARGNANSVISPVADSRSPASSQRCCWRASLMRTVTGP
jgi:hypothetical protein